MEMFVTHENLGNTHLDSAVKIQRHRGPIDAAAAQVYAGLFDKHFTAAAFAGLPEVAEYAALHDRAAGMDKELHRIELERQAADLEQQQLLASTTSGEKLAASLSAAEEKQRAAAQRLQQSQAGARTFHTKLAQAEDKARAAIGRQLRTVLAKIIAEHGEMNETAKKQLAAAAEPILDELAALDIAGVECGAHRDLEWRIETLLRTVQPAGKH